MLDLIQKLKARIFEYREEKITKADFNENRLVCCTSIELAVIFAELFYKTKRKISKSEIVFFQGGRYISDIIGSDPLYEDIYDMYYKLSNEINDIFG
jgi:hypothetical protein